jgi:peptide/nickel transport system substrate-binding protein
MSDEHSVRRAGGLLAVFFAFVLVGTPLGVLDLSENASADDPGIDVDRTFVIGTNDMLISTLNPNTYTMTAEAMVIFPCYSGLLQYSVDSELIGDIAYEWSSTPDGLTWYFRLHDNVYFCDPAEPEVMDESRHLTGEDVVWTLQMYNDNERSRLHPSLPGIIEEMGFVDGDPYHLYITLNGPYAPFLGAMSQPILPKYYWESEDPQNFDNSPPIGSGPFYYATDGIPTAGVAVLKRNPIWFMTEEQGWSSRVDSLVLVEMLNEGTAYVALINGDIDFLLNVPAYLFIDVLPDQPYVTTYSQSAGFVYELNLNQMTNELRDSLGGAFNAGTNNQLLLDPAVKNAIAMCVDKDRFVEDILMGLGETADSLVPKASPWHYDYPDPVVFDTLAARESLFNAGWAYDLMGNPATTETLPLCKAGGSDPLSFKFSTLDSEVGWWLGAELIVDGCGAAGIELDLNLVSINEMNTMWYSADYDMWLWDWIFDPFGDPAIDVLEVLTTDAIGLDSDVFYSDPTFDALYEASLVTMDPELRADIIDEMQAMAYEDMGCQCVAYRDDLYAASTRNWMNFGDLDSKYMLLPDNSMQYLSMQMSPIENEAPIITGVTWSVMGNVGEDTEFMVSAEDDYVGTGLEVRWFWGDGEKSDWTTLGVGSGSANGYHPYDRDGVYTAYVAVRESTTSCDEGVFDGFHTWKKITVTISDMNNDAPVIEEITVTHDLLPDPPDTATSISFSVVATDDEDDPLFITWDFGDGTGADGQSVIHTFPAGGVYEVTVSVTDNVFGSGVRPVLMTVVIAVRDNLPPSVSVPAFGLIDSKTEVTFLVVASDPDGDLLMFVWDWGDGTMSVTYEAMATHSYRHGGTYVITVTVSDLTGLYGHEMSDSGMVYVSSGHHQSNVAFE